MKGFATCSWFCCRSVKKREGIKGRCTVSSLFSQKRSIFERSRCERHFFPMLRRFFVFLMHMNFITCHFSVPLSSSLHFTSLHFTSLHFTSLLLSSPLLSSPLLSSPLLSSPLLSSPLLSSPLLFSSLLFSSLLFSSLLLSSPLLSVSFIVSVVVVSSLSCVVVVLFYLFCAVTASVAAALLLLVAVAARAAVGGSCVFLDGCFSFLVDFSFCLFSLSFRPLLSSCQVHSARRVACTQAGHHDDG